MKHGSLTYKYIKQRNGRGKYGGVTIEIIRTNRQAFVTDACEWETFKGAYPAFVESDILKLWKQSAINTASEAINSFSFLNNVEIILRDIMGLYTDTCPSHIGAAMMIAVFDYCESPLDQKNLLLLDEFVERNDKTDIIPDFTQLPLAGYKNHSIKNG
ncbi:hypothetical protein F0919_02350 [Taibaiella lutea]|uniref:Uncharacterized protein n=1 Tax=Taibaiella lutea TaxID=2608001 RepID=A0A5M6CTN9_9BACT|nr:hypothetical protein [Taibaiella lutea]KAA5536529.1 hypothetical protein F0919_02350 [Taibaiella lutea]